MKKFLTIFLVLIIMASIVVSCILAYTYFTKGGLSSSKPLFTLDNYPKVDASLATQPLTNAFIKNFTSENVNTDELDYTNTHPGYVRLINGEVDKISWVNGRIFSNCSKANSPSLILNNDKIPNKYEFVVIAGSAL